MILPSAIPSLVFCHEARDVAGADLDPISQIPGKYGKPATQVQATAGFRPLLKLVGAGGFKALRFDNVDDVIFFDAGIVLATPYTVFHVYAGNGTDSFNHMALAGDPAYNGGWGGSWRFVWTGALSGVYQANAYPTGGSEINSPNGTYTQFGVKIHCMAGTPAIGTLSYWINNSLIGTSSNATGPGTPSIGSAAAPAHCDWIASIGFSTELSSTDRIGIYNYIVQDIFGGGVQQFSQANIEVVQEGVANVRFSQGVIEYVRSIAGAQKFYGQVIG